MKKVVSFSGGRTSAYMVHRMEELRKQNKWDVDYIFLDTGAEHPKTYEFIRNVVKHYGIDLICLRLKINPELGKANTYQRIPVEQCTNDLQPWRDMLSKYSTPYQGGEFCTDRMKLVPITKWCNEHYGKGNYESWLGIREDEPRRLKPMVDGERILRRDVKTRYLADISDFDKEDVLDFWEAMPFNLEIEEWLGNCVFCMKKGTNKLALAARQEPELAQQFMDMVDEPTVREVERKYGKTIIFRQKNSLQSIIAMYADKTEDEIRHTIRGQKALDTGSCSESCEVFNEVTLNPDLFDWGEDE